MKGVWLEKNNAQRCIFFMAGWGMDEKPFRCLAGKDYDLYLCYDYRTLELPEKKLFADYSQLELVAWSMGVWVAAALFPARDSWFSHTTAMGGTLFPLDKERGIPEAVFEATLQRMDKARLEDFYCSMFESPLQAASFLAHSPARSQDSLVEELRSLKENIAQTGPVEDIYERRIITVRDRIFPARHQLRAWGRENSQRLKWPHFPFYLEEAQAMLFSSATPGKCDYR